MGLPGADKAEISEAKIVRYLLSPTRSGGSAAPPRKRRHGNGSREDGLRHALRCRWIARCARWRKLEPAQRLVYKRKGSGAEVRDRASAEKEDW